MRPPVKLGVLGSGSGSNFQSILDAIQKGTLNAEVALVLSDNPDAYILTRAQKAGIPTKVIDCLGFKSKFPDEAQLQTADDLKSAGVEFVCLAGFMRLIKAALLQAFPQRIINIHPSLLPNYPGLHAWEQAIHDKATESGCTIHYVDSGMDTGTIIAQSKVPVYEYDTAQSLHQRIQVEEHKLYPSVLKDLLEKM